MLSGSLVALVTPMHAQGELDFGALSLLIEKQIQAGIHGLVIAGSTGEAVALTLDELTQLIVFVVEQVQKKVPVIVGVGTNITTTTIKRAQLAESLGVDGLLVVTPYYNKPSQEGLYLHYRSVAKAVRLPIYLYNVPGRTGCDLLPQTVQRLAQDQSNICGLKEAHNTKNRHQDLLALEWPKHFSLLSGDDLTAPDFILAGAHGVISVIANIVPDTVVKLIELAQSGDVLQAQALDLKLKKLNQLLFCQSNPIPVKWVLHVMGLLDTGIRLPLLPLEEQYKAAIHTELAALKLISSKEYS